MRIVNGAKQIMGIVKGKEVLISPLRLCFIYLFIYFLSKYMQEL